MATAERDAQHDRVGPAHPGERCRLACADAFVAHGPVADGLELGVEARDLLLEEEEFQAVRPQAVLAAFDLSHRCFEDFELLARLVGVAHPVGTLGADFRLLLDHDRAVHVLCHMRRARLEDGDVELAVLATDLDFEVGLHVLGGDAVLMDDGARDALANLLFVAVLQRSACDVVEDLPFGDIGSVARLNGHIAAAVVRVIRSGLFVCRLPSHGLFPFHRSHHYWKTRRRHAPRRRHRLS